MALSIAGLVLAVALLLLGRTVGSMAIGALFLSLPFGASAWTSLPSLGGSSPLVYTLFAMMIIAGTVFRPRAFDAIQQALATHWSISMMALLALYACMSAYVYPRLFNGQTSAFVPIKGIVFEVPLSPVSGNITQSAYLSLGIICTIAVIANLCRHPDWRSIARAMLAWCAMNAILGWGDLAGKFVGIPDVLAPIRTASYALLTEAEEAGFWRVSGGFPEASGFAAHTLGCAAYAFAFWRETGRPLAALIAAANVAILMLSTSSTGYVALALVSLPLAISVTKNITKPQISRRELQLLLAAMAAIAVVTCLLVFVPKIAAPFLDLLDQMVIRKSSSGSAEERGYWNRKSLEALADTAGLGVGLGSSRASSWVVAVASQLGLVGMAVFAALLVALWSAPARAELMGIRRGTAAAGLVRGARAAALATFVSSSISSGSADPGIHAFICIGIALSLPAVIGRARRAPSPDPGIAGASAAGAV